MHNCACMRLSPFLVKRSWTVTMPIYMYNVPLEVYMQSFFVCYHSLELPRKNRYCTGFVGGSLLQGAQTISSTGRSADEWLANF